MDKKELIKKIEEYVKEKMGEDDRDIHGWGHVWRVRRWALKINEKEKLVDPFILEVTALLHDIGRDDKEEKDHCLAGERIAKEFLQKFSYFSDEEIKQITEGVREHGQGGDNDLADILQDADRLDLSGVIGLIRVSMFRNNWPFFRSEEDFAKKDYTQAEVDELIRKPADEKSLFLLWNMQLSIFRNQMNTRTGKELIAERMELQERLLKELREDLLG